MLLAIDIGNTNLAIGLFDGPALKSDWRLETSAGRTADEYAVLLRGMFELAGWRLDQVTGAIIASVVPPATWPVENLCRKHLKVEPVVVGPGTRTGMKILIDNPREVGADRIVNAVAAFRRWPQGAVVVDFGTATNLDVVTSRGEYAGGVIAPGLRASADALYHATAKLPRVELVRPRSVIGKNTVACMQSGLVFGYAGMIDALVAGIRREVDFQPRVVATGGLAHLIAPESREIEECDDMLTLNGLQILHERNS